jgi:hypothetical protein
MAHASDHENPAVTALRRLKAADTRALLSRGESMTTGGWKASTQAAKEAAGLLHRVEVGSRVMITTESFWNHLIDLAAAPSRKLRAPKTMFKQRRREPTPQELSALKRANDRRHAEAQGRKGANRLARVRKPEAVSGN